MNLVQLYLAFCIVKFKNLKKKKKFKKSIFVYLLKDVINIFVNKECKTLKSCALANKLDHSKRKNFTQNGVVSSILMKYCL